MLIMSLGTLAECLQKRHPDDPACKAAVNVIREIAMVKTRKDLVGLIDRCDVLADPQLYL